MILLDGLGTLSSVASEIVFILVLVTVASGWNITRATLIWKTVVIGLLALLVLLYSMLFLWAELGIES